jgi:hypothetical protein
MKFHLPSYILGVATGLAVQGAREKLRPAMVELGTVALEVSKIAWSVVERQREWLEDLWAELDERVRERFQTDRTQNGHPEHTAGHAVRS